MNWASVIDRLVGVIDLKEGKAVHGVAGRRDHYQPVQLSLFAKNGIDGDPLGLLDHYRESGIRRFYIADLDSLEGGEIQSALLERLLGHQPHDKSQHSTPDEHWILDVGLHEQWKPPQFGWLIPIHQEYRHKVAWVVASESARSFDTPQTLCRRIDPASLILGIDFRDQAFVGPTSLASPSGNIDASALNEWVDSGRSAGIRSALVLDVASVGTRTGPSGAHLCRDFRLRNPDWRLVSGGGCRDANDVTTYVRAGCDECLVATALQR